MYSQKELEEKKRRFSCNSFHALIVEVITAPKPTVAINPNKDVNDSDCIQ